MNPGKYRFQGGTSQEGEVKFCNFAWGRLDPEGHYVCPLIRCPEVVKQLKQQNLTHGRYLERWQLGHHQQLYQRWNILTQLLDSTDIHLVNATLRFVELLSSHAPVSTPSPSPPTDGCAMVNILARNTYLFPSPEICEVLLLPHFLRCCAILRLKIYQMSLIEVKNCQIVEIRLINLKINKENLITK